MQVVILACQQQIANLCDHRNLRQYDILTILGKATDAAILNAIEITC